MQTITITKNLAVEQKQLKIAELNSLIRVYRLKDDELAFAIRECNNFNRKCVLVKCHARLVQKLNKMQLEKFLLEKDF